MVKRTLSLALCLCLLLPVASFAQEPDAPPGATARPAAAGLMASASREVRLIDEQARAAERWRTSARNAVAFDGQAPASGDRHLSKSVLIASLAMIGAGAALMANSYSSEDYNYTYCPGCTPSMSTTLNRDTSSAGMFWSGASVAGAGVALLVYRLVRK